MASVPDKDRLVTHSFKQKGNNIFMIDSKKVDFTPKADGTAQKQITIGLITKTEEQLITQIIIVPFKIIEQ